MLEPDKFKQVIFKVMSNKDRTEPKPLQKNGSQTSLGEMPNPLTVAVDINDIDKYKFDQGMRESYSQKWFQGFAEKMGETIIIPTPS